MARNQKRRVTPIGTGGEPGATWTVRGVTMETRQAVTIAARRRGQNVGLFVDQALREVSTRVLQGEHPPPAPRQEHLLEQMLEQMRSMNDRSATLEARVATIEVERRRGWLRRIFGLRSKHQELPASAASG